MSSRPISLVVLMQSRPGCEERVERQLVTQLTRIRSEEPACTYIAGSRHAEDPTRFMIYEEWRDEEEFEAFYAEREWMQTHLDQMRELVDAGELTRWELVA